MSPPADHAFMERALALARLAAAREEVPVGAVLVLEDRIVAEAHNEIVARRDPTAHAEMLVIRAAAARQGNERLSGATLVVTLEPCAMCVYAMVLARIDRLVFGAADPKTGAAGSVMDLTRKIEFNHRLEVVGGVMSEESAALLREFFQRRRRGAGAAERARLEIE